MTPDHSEVLLEEMNSNLKLILEDHTGLNKKIDENHKEFQEFRKENQDSFQKVFKFRKETEDSFKTVFKYLFKIDDEIQSIKSKLNQIKSELKNKVDLSFLKFFLKILEKRIKKLEINYTELHSLILQQS